MNKKEAIKKENFLILVNFKIKRMLLGWNFIDFNPISKMLNKSFFNKETKKLFAAISVIAGTCIGAGF